MIKIKRMGVWLRFLFFILLITITPAAQALTKNKLQQISDQYLSSHQRAEYFSGLAITVMSPKLGHPLTVYTGRNNHYTRAPLTPETLFQVGSITKSFITAILLQLADDPAYRFNIDDPIDQYLPKYPNWHAISVRQLMNMTSGIPDYFHDARIVNDYTQHPYQMHRPKAWVDYMYSKPLLFAPGAKFHYSNTNYFILGMLIEKLTGHTVGQEIKDRILTPLNLQNTFYITHQPAPSVRARMAHGYQFERGFERIIPRGLDVTDYSLSYMDAAGGVVSTSDDMAKWSQFLFQPGKVLSAAAYQKLTQVVSQKTGQTIAKPTANQPKTFGLGIAMRYSPTLHAPYFFYEGMTLGYRCIYVYVPSKRMTIAITINSSFDGKDNHLLALINQISAQLL